MWYRTPLFSQKSGHPPVYRTSLFKLGYILSEGFWIKGVFTLNSVWVAAGARCVCYRTPPFNQKSGQPPVFRTSLFKLGHILNEGNFQIKEGFTLNSVWVAAGACCVCYRTPLFNQKSGHPPVFRTSLFNLGHVSSKENFQIKAP